MTAQVPYESIAGVNWSSLWHMATSPRMYRHRLAHPEKSKPAYRLGSAAHCAVLEPEKFDAVYLALDSDEIEEIAPPRNTKAGKAREKEYREAHPGTPKLDADAYKQAILRWRYPKREIITTAERDDALAMRDALHDHPIARKLLQGGRSEETVTWTDSSGVACKCRVDYIRPDFLLDLKSARDPAPSRFRWDAANYGYIGKMAFYHDGATAARLVDGKTSPYIIAVRNSDDYDVAVYQFTSTSLETGRGVYRTLLRRLIQCTEANYWPGIAPELQFLDIVPQAGPIDEEDF